MTSGVRATRRPRFRHLVGFVGWYAVELVSSYRRMTLDIIAPATHVTPSVVRYDCLGPAEAHVGTLGLLVTLSPGTVVLATEAHVDASDTGGMGGMGGMGGTGPEDGEQDADPAAWTMWVHGIHHEDPEELREWVADLERRLLLACGRDDLVDDTTPEGAS